MKKIVLLFALMLSTNLFAEEVTLKQAKCTLFGNLKIKVYGLESYGRVGTGYLRGNLPMSDDCDAVKEDFEQSLGRGSSSVDVNLDTRIIVIRERDDDDKIEKRWRCTTKERKTLTVAFPEFPYVAFKNVIERTLRVNHYCR